MRMNFIGDAAYQFRMPMISTTSMAIGAMNFTVKIKSPDHAVPLVSV